MSDQEDSRRADHDSPWKMALDYYFQEFVGLLFPAIHDQVDWSKGYSFLDKELQQITPDADSGRRHADKLIKVHAKDGSETWVLIHVEVQGEPEEAFAERMYTYQYRLRDRYHGMDVVSLAVLADTRKSFRPTTFHYQRWGCELTFTFPTAKLIDWEDNWSKLETSDNVFALVVMAQIKAKRVKDGTTRKDVKVALTRLLFERGYSREQIVRLFNIIDWMIQLPEALEPEFVRAVHAIEEEKHMPYINTVERLAIEKVRQENLQETEQRVLESKRDTARHLLEFGVLSDDQIAEATGLSVEDVAKLRIEDKH
jgi:predicted transposase/invertase (TIGR01784 family)